MFETVVESWHGKINKNIQFFIEYGDLFHSNNVLVLSFLKITLHKMLLIRHKNLQAQQEREELIQIPLLKMKPNFIKKENNNANETTAQKHSLHNLK